MKYKVESEITTLPTVELLFNVFESAVRLLEMQKIETFLWIRERFFEKIKNC